MKLNWQEASGFSPEFSSVISEISGWLVEYIPSSTVATQAGTLCSKLLATYVISKVLSRKSTQSRNGILGKYEQYASFKISLIVLQNLSYNLYVIHVL